MDFLRFFLRILGIILIAIALFALVYSQGSALAGAIAAATGAAVLFVLAAVLKAPQQSKQRA